MKRVIQVMARHTEGSSSDGPGGLLGVVVVCQSCVTRTGAGIHTALKAMV